MKTGKDELVLLHELILTDENVGITLVATSLEEVIRSILPRIDGSPKFLAQETLAELESLLQHFNTITLNRAVTGSTTSHTEYVHATYVGTLAFKLKKRLEAYLG